MVKNILALALVLYVVSIAETPSQRIKMEEGFSIAFPVDWVPIPKGILDQRAKGNLEAAGRPGNQFHFDYGFQPASNDAFLTVPYVLITIKSGIISEKDFTNYKNIDKTKLQDLLGSLASGFEIGVPYYSPNENTLWIYTENAVPDVGRVSGLSGTILTSFGTISVHCYARTGEFSVYKNIFYDIVRSVHIDQAFVYNPRNWHFLPFSQDKVSNIIVAIVVGALAALILSLFRKWRNG